MSWQQLISEIPDEARDLRLNLQTLFAEDGMPGLAGNLRFGVAASLAYALASPELLQAIQDLGGDLLTDATLKAGKSAASIMSMNNVYYRSLHLMDDPELKKLPARLRMNVIANPGIEKVDFEAMCFAISALAGCGQCLVSHKAELIKHGIEMQGIQSLLRLAAVLQGVDCAYRVRSMQT